MATFVTNTTQEEDVLFVAWGEYKAGQDKKKSVLIKAGQTIEGVLTKRKSGGKYKETYVLQVKGYEKPIVITGKQDLIKQMGHTPNTKPKMVAKEGDLIQIKFIEKTKTNNQNDFYKFEVAIAQ